MTPEIFILIMSIILGLIHMVSTGAVMGLKYGFKYSLSSRDEQKEPSIKGARLIRAYNNFMQSFPFFAAVVIIAFITNTHNQLTVFGAYMYFWGRLLYVPMYVFNVQILRSIMWGISIAGIVAIIVAIL